MGIATAVTMVLAAAIAGGHASAGLRVTAVVVHPAAIPVPRRELPAAEARRAPAGTARPKVAAPAGGSPNAVLFTDGAPPAFTVRGVSVAATTSAGVSGAGR